MGLSFTPEQKALRRKVRAFMAGDVVQDSLHDLHQRPFREEMFSWELHRMLAERSWLAIHWPVEYGGGGKTMIETGVIVEETIRAGHRLRPGKPSRRRRRLLLVTDSGLYRE